MLSILVVDDELLLRWSLVETLTHAGHDLIEAGDGASAIRAIADAPKPFDVVLLDFRLPDSDDLVLLANIRRRSPTTAVILMTAFGTPEMVIGAQSLGVSAVVKKPFDMDTVDDMVRMAAASSA
jgi:DNA-binding NtrC family response regulator